MMDCSRYFVQSMETGGPGQVRPAVTVIVSLEVGVGLVAVVSAVDI